MSKKQTHQFQAETKQLLNLMIHSLYSNSEIFLRELISNSSDAIDKLRFASLKDDKILEGKEELTIQIDTDEKKKTITITDNGIGMNAEEVVANIGTIANSGTKKFLENLGKDEVKDSNLIGQFGVGFYSAFIVAKKVELFTRKAGDSAENGSKWVSNGEGEYSLEQIKLEDFGTKIVLHLRAEHKEYANDYRLKGIISKYSDHITVPIKMLKPAEDEKDATIEYETVNKATAFWMRDKNEIKTEEYNEFYKNLTYDFEAPLTTIHNRVEGKLDYTSLFFIPSKAPFDMYEPKRKGGIKLYAKRVFIMEDNEDLMPLYLRFMRGIIDTADLSLNVSREILQKNKVIDSIKKASVTRILKELEKMAKNSPENYAKFWSEFGAVMKEGIVEDFANKDKIAKLLRFATNKSENSTQNATLECYVKNMQKDQEHIYYITADSYEAAKNSPHLEFFNNKDIEVLLLSDRVDEWFVGNFTEFEGKQLKSITKGDLADFESEEDKEKAEKTAKDFDEVIGKIKEVLGEKVKDVKISKRLSDSPSCLIADENDMGGNMQRIMQSLGQDVPETKPILEINPEHKLVKKLKDKMDNDIVEILFDGAVLAEGGQLKDGANFIKKINKLIS
jgi:molecular chaperone HtpG